MRAACPWDHVVVDDIPNSDILDPEESPSESSSDAPVSGPVAVLQDILHNVSRASRFISGTDSLECIPTISFQLLSKND